MAFFVVHGRSVGVEPALSTQTMVNQEEEIRNEKSEAGGALGNPRAVGNQGWRNINFNDFGNIH